LHEVQSKTAALQKVIVKMEEEAQEDANYQDDCNQFEQEVDEGQRILNQVLI